MTVIKPNQSRTESQIIALLDKLKSVPDRDPEVAQHGKELFLLQAASLKSSKPSVSQHSEVRHKRRINFLVRKGSLEMNMIMAILVIASLLFGGAGTTVYAAQSSVPNEWLYPLKLLSEDIRLEMATNAQTRLNLSLNFAERRINELAELVKEGELPPEPLITRWQQQIEMALRLAAEGSEDQMNGALQQIQQQLRLQQQTIAQLQTSEQVEPLLLRIRLMIRTRLQLVESGLNEPQMYRQRIREGQPVDDAGDESLSGNEVGPGNSGNECQDCPFNAGQDENQLTGNTPVPNNGYGPGPGPNTTPLGNATPPAIQVSPNPTQGSGSQSGQPPNPQPDNGNGGGEGNGGGGNGGGGHGKP